MIDSSIALGVKPVQIESPMNALAQALQMQQGMQNNQLGQLKLDEYARTKDRSNKLVQLMQSLPGNATDDQRMDALKSSGYFDEADKLQTGQLSRLKTTADASLANAHAGNFTQQTATSVADNKYKAAAQHAQDLALVNTPQDVVAYIKDGVAKGIFPAMDDAQIQQKMAQFSSVEAFKQAAMKNAVPVIEQYKQAAENARNSANNATSRANNSATVGATLRGQDLTDARSRETLSASMSKPFEVTGADGQPALVQQDKQGNLRPVTGFTAKTQDKPLNDSQSKALLFGERMKQSDKIINDLGKEGTTSSIPGSRTPIIGGVISGLQSDNQQMLDQAKRDFLNAVLRRESGAAISSGEFTNGDQQYFPQVGDSQKVLEQKKNNRDLATRGVLIEVPEKQRGSLSNKSAVLPKGSNDIESLLNKYK